jgi:hypothetical protein
MNRISPYLVGIIGVTVLLAFVLAPMSVFFPPTALIVATAVFVGLVGLIGLAIRSYWRFD